MASTIETYLLALASTMGQGIPATPTSTASSGTVTSGTTDTFDAVLGVYQWNAVANRRYRVVIDNLKGGGTVANDLYQLTIRYRGDATTPTTADAAAAQTAWEVQTTGGPGQTGINFGGTILSTASGTNTIAFFAQRSTGTGTFTPLSAGTGRQLYVVDIGVF